MTGKLKELAAAASYDGLAMVEGTVDRARAVAGFVVVDLKATAAYRSVEAVGYVNGVQICSASVADSSLTGVISTPKQSFTLPVPAGANWRVTWNVANNQGEVKVWTLDS